jgi:predicted nucleotide-binding protein (sugar kinase/HSP70/actin superfamily)
MFKPIKERYPKANIIPIDYDPGISSVNQLNRIKLMLSVAMKNL